MPSSRIPWRSDLARRVDLPCPCCPAPKLSFVTLARSGAARRVAVPAANLSHTPTHPRILLCDSALQRQRQLPTCTRVSDISRHVPQRRAQSVGAFHQTTPCALIHPVSQISKPNHDSYLGSRLNGPARRFWPQLSILPVVVGPATKETLSTIWVGWSAPRRPIETAEPPRPYARHYSRVRKEQHNSLKVSHFRPCHHSTPDTAAHLSTVRPQCPCHQWPSPRYQHRGGRKTAPRDRTSSSTSKA